MEICTYFVGFVFRLPKSYQRSRNWRLSNVILPMTRNAEYSKFKGLDRTYHIRQTKYRFNAIKANVNRV